LKGKLASCISLVLVALCARPAAAQRIPPGQESLASDMLGGDALLPGGCTWEGASVDAARVVARYRCPALAQGLTLTLRAHGDSPDGVQARTSKFALVPEPAREFPPALLGAVEARIRAREQRWSWEVNDPDAGHRAPREGLPYDTRWPPGGVVLLPLTALGILVSLAVLLGASARAPRSPSRRESPSVSALTAGLLALALLAGGLALGRFQLAFDDYRFLVNAVTDPWGWDTMARFLTVSCFFRAAALLGGSVPFLVANALALGLAVLFWIRALTRRGFDHDEAALAGAWFALAPGAPDLLSHASGIENLAATAWILGILLLVGGDEARPDASRAERIGRASLVVALCAAGVLVKYPFMACLPPAIWLWARRGTVFRHPAFVGAIAAVVASLSVLLLRRPDQGVPAIPLFGLGKLGLNLQLEAHALRPLVNAFIGTGLVLIGYPLLRAACHPGEPGPDRWAPLRGEVVRIRHAAWGAVSERVGPLPLGLTALLLTAVFLAPPLFNASYWGAYYVLLGTAPLAAFAARVVMRVGEPRRLPLAVQLLALLVAVPWAALRPPNPDAASVRAPGWLHELAEVVAARPEPGRLVLTAACASPEETLRSAEDLRLLLFAAGDKFGVCWVTGWRRTEVVVGDPTAPSGDLRVAYCKGRVMRITE
jgi:hypothetical protein